MNIMNNNLESSNWFGNDFGGYTIECHKIDHDGRTEKIVVAKKKF